MMQVGTRLDEWIASHSGPALTPSIGFAIPALISLALGVHSF